MEKIIKSHKLERIIQSSIMLTEVIGMLAITFVIIVAAIGKMKIAKWSLLGTMLLVLIIIVLYIIRAKIVKSKISLVEEKLIHETRKILRQYEAKNVINLVEIEDGEIQYKVKIEANYAALGAIETKFKQRMLELKKELSFMGKLTTEITFK